MITIDVSKKTCTCCRIYGSKNANSILDDSSPKEIIQKALGITTIEEVTDLLLALQIILTVAFDV